MASSVFSTRVAPTRCDLPELVILLLAGTLTSGSALGQAFETPQEREERLLGVGPELPATLSFCELPLPGDRERDSGLADLYLANEEGRSFLLVPSITGRQIYTDNVELAPDGDEESAFITGVIPALTVCGSGARLSGQFDYQGEAYYYWGDTSRNEVFNRLRADGTAEVLEERFFVDAFALNRQQAISAEGTFSDDNALDTGNRTDVLTLGVSPWLLQDLGSLGQARLRYRYRRTDYDEDSDSEIGDTYSNTYQASLVSPESNPVWTWRLNYDDERLEEDGEDTEYFGEASAELGYRLTGRLTVLGEAGLQHDYNEDGTTDRFASEFWNTGFRWNGARTYVEARVGRQFFGTSYMASVQRESPRLTTSISYTETPQVRSRLELERGSAGVFDRFDRPGEFDSPDDEDFVLSTRNEVFVQRRLSANANYRTGRSQIRLNAFFDDREFVRDDDNETAYGTLASWRWQWTPRTSVIPLWRWERREFDDGQVDYISRYQVSLARLVSPTIQAGATLRHQSRNSTSESSTYDENALILEVTKLF